MPRCGSQITLCDLPVRFDTYEGCSHACSYCFANRKRDISKVSNGESVSSLVSFINGKRTLETNAFDWDIPLHWGGMSDPFQPIERKTSRSLECLRVFAETQYPFVVSTKNALIAEGEYFELIKKCNCVVQFSALSSRYDAWERGASTFQERLDAARKIAKYKRVVVRCQPYVIELYRDILKNIPIFAEAGVYGLVFEGMKAHKIFPGALKLGNDFVYPVELLKKHFSTFKRLCHEYGMKFYSGENRLRAMGDDLCCCGVDGMGWKTNTANINHYLYDRDNYTFTDTMKKVECGAFKSLSQSSILSKTKLTYEEMMNICTKLRAFVSPLLPKEDSYFYIQDDININEYDTYKKQFEGVRQYLKDALKKSGYTASYIEKQLGTAGMCGHYFGDSQWEFPTREKYEILSKYLDLHRDYDDCMKVIKKYEYCKLLKSYDERKM